MNTLIQLLTVHSDNLDPNRLNHFHKAHILKEPKNTNKNIEMNVILLLFIFVEPSFPQES